MFQEILRDLGGLARSGFTLYDQDLVVSDGSEKIFSVRKDGKAASHFLEGLLLHLSL